MASSFAVDKKFYIDPAKLLPLERFLPKPKGASTPGRGGNPALISHEHICLNVNASKLQTRGTSYSAATCPHLDIRSAVMQCRDLHVHVHVQAAEAAVAAEAAGWVSGAAGLEAAADLGVAADLEAAVAAGTPLHWRLP